MTGKKGGLVFVFVAVAVVVGIVAGQMFGARIPLLNKLKRF